MFEMPVVPAVPPGGKVLVFRYWSGSDICCGTPSCCLSAMLATNLPPKPLPACCSGVANGASARCGSTGAAAGTAGTLIVGVTNAGDVGLEVMIGCMVGTSLAMAPATLLARGAAHIDLDSPLLLTRDREPALRVDGGAVFPPEQTWWG